ncbi:MAG TPA: hypothetical protein VN845_02360 [Solirubrobacteraceae bacterium]|nr:hypothetical protein [Solirubrobacteraceae bacterium]
MSGHAVLIILALTFSIAVFFMLRSGENLRFETPADSRRIVMAAVAIVATKRHWQVMAQSDDGASFRYHRRPNALIAVVLLFFFVIPGIVYMVLAGKRESLLLNVYSDSAGMTVAQLTSNGFRGKFAGRALAQQVSVRAGTMALREAGSSAVAGGSSYPSALSSQSAK